MKVTLQSTTKIVEVEINGQRVPARILGRHDRERDPLPRLRDADRRRSSSQP